MEKDMIFFGQEGLTSTSANHVSNMTKEFIQTIESELDNVSFYTTSIALISGENEHVTNVGVSSVDGIEAKLDEIAKAKSLIAWLREAIKARFRLQDEIDTLSLEQYCEKNGLEFPKYPENPSTLTEDEYLAQLNIKERNRYFRLETECAVIGKYIHPNGAYSNARKELKNRIQNPNKVSGAGRDCIIYTYKPTVSCEDVDKVFFELQSKHRELQAELNGMKHKMEMAIEANSKEVAEKYRLDIEAYNAKTQELNAQLAQYKLDEGAKVRNLKIIVPNSLVDIYEKVKGLGK